MRHLMSWHRSQERFNTNRLDLTVCWYLCPFLCEMKADVFPCQRQGLGWTSHIQVWHAITRLNIDAPSKIVTPIAKTLLDGNKRHRKVDSRWFDSPIKSHRVQLLLFCTHLRAGVNYMLVGLRLRDTLYDSLRFDSQSRKHKSKGNVTFFSWSRSRRRSR